MVLLFTAQSHLPTTLKMKALENTAGKRENAGYQHFLFFPRCFLFYQREILSFQKIVINVSSANALKFYHNISVIIEDAFFKIGQVILPEGSIHTCISWVNSG